MTTDIEQKQEAGATLADWLKTERQKKIIDLMWGKITEEEYLQWLQSEKKEPCDEHYHGHRKVNWLRE